MEDVVPKYFPGEKVKKTIGGAEVVITKIGIGYDGQIDYMCWDGSSYDWLDEWQIYSEVPRVIGFNIINNDKGGSNKDAER